MIHSGIPGENARRLPFDVSLPDIPALRRAFGFPIELGGVAIGFSGSACAEIAVLEQVRKRSFFLGGVESFPEFPANPAISLLAALAESADVALHAPLGELQLRTAVGTGADEALRLLIVE